MPTIVSQFSNLNEIFLKIKKNDHTGAINLRPSTNTVPLSIHSDSLCKRL